MQYCVSRDHALRGGGGSAVLRITGQCPEEGGASAVLRITGQCPEGGASAVLRVTGQCPEEGGPVQYCLSRDNALRGGQCSIVYHGTMP